MRGDIDEIQILLNNGADINAIGEHHYTPLHNATEQGHQKMVEFLLNQGANTLIKNDNDLTAKELEKILGNDEIYQMIDKFENNIKTI